MFCLYCGSNLPDDAVFCNRCGKQQGVANRPAAEVTGLPLSVPLEALPDNRQLPVGNVPIVQENPSTPDRLKPAGKFSQRRMLTIISTLVAIGIVISIVVVIFKLSTNPTAMPQTAKIITTPEKILCSGDTSLPLHEDDGQASQGDQGSFTPVTLCTHILASSYAINFHATSPYILLYLYDSKHAKYEIDYNVYLDHILVVSYPGFSTANAISVGKGSYSTADWHTYRFEFRSDSVRVLVDGTEVLTGPAGFTDDGSGDALLLQSHQITMDQFSVTLI